MTVMLRNEITGSPKIFAAYRNELVHGTYGQTEAERARVRAACGKRIPPSGKWPVGFDDITVAGERVSIPPGETWVDGAALLQSTIASNQGHAVRWYIVFPDTPDGQAEMQQVLADEPGLVPFDNTLAGIRRIGLQGLCMSRLKDVSRDAHRVSVNPSAIFSLEQQNKSLQAQLDALSDKKSAVDDAQRAKDELAASRAELEKARAELAQARAEKSITDAKKRAAGGATARLEG